MVSRNLLDPNGPDGERPAGSLVADIAPPRWWCVQALTLELPISRSKLHAVLQSVPPEHHANRTRYWSLATVYRILLDAELRRSGAIASGDAVDPNVARARRDAALAEETELRVAEKRAEVLPVGQAAEAGAAALVACKAQLDILGPTLGDRLAELDKAEDCAALIRTETDAILASLADTMERLGRSPPAA